MCFVLTHSYTQKTLATDQLRGFDSTLFNALKKLGYTPKLYACILNQTHVYESSESEYTCSPVNAELETVDVSNCVAILCGNTWGMNVDEQRSAYTGNECVNGYTSYFSACLVIEAPEEDSRKRKLSEECVD